jgi:hypothetical protein
MQLFNRVRQLAAALLLLLSALGAPLPAAAAAATRDGPSTAVVFVGGLGSSPVTTRAVFSSLASALSTDGGFGAQNLLTFSYDPAGPAYLPAQTCQPLATSADHLASFVRGLRQAQHVEQGKRCGGRGRGTETLDKHGAVRRA